MVELPGTQIDRVLLPIIQLPDNPTPLMDKNWSF